jgi:DNA-binding transcriptional LysR family regulator
MSLTRALVERLRDGRLDLAIIAGELTEPGFRAEPLGHDEFAWMASPRLKVPRRVLRPADLQRWPILSLSEDSFHYPVLERWFREAGAFYRSAASCNNMDVIASLTAAGLGVSLLPRACYRAELSARRLVVLRTAPPIPRVPFSLIHRVDRPHPLGAPIAALAKQVSELAR